MCSAVSVLGYTAVVDGRGRVVTIGLCQFCQLKDCAQVVCLVRLIVNFPRKRLALSCVECASNPVAMRPRVVCIE